MARTKVQPKRGSKLRMEARPINARQRLDGGETVRKGRCPLNPAPPGALAGAFPLLSAGVRESEGWMEIIGAQGALPLEPRPALGSL